MICINNYSFTPNVFNGKEGERKTKFPSKPERNQNKRNFKKLKKEDKKVYIVRNDYDMDSSNDEEGNMFLMEDPQENEVTSYLSYHDLYRICKKLNKEKVS